MKQTHKLNGKHKSARALPLKASGKGAKKTSSNDKSSDTKSKKSAAAPLIKMGSARTQLKPELLIEIHENMVKARALEERLIKMYKQNDGYFWIGGPGEEAFNVPLGLQIHKGSGPDYDYLHLHYRSSAILVAMGMGPEGAVKQMKNVASDPYSGGRNFSNHYSIREWNVPPITSTIETQYAVAIGTGIAQARHGGKGLTFVNGGDAGTAEGEFASCLVWASRPALPLPILMVVTNNEWGISTASKPQHGDTHIHARGTAFGIKNSWVNGNDPEAAYLAIQEAMEYVRTERKPYLMEARTSRLYGHSSATGCNYVTEEDDCLRLFEKKLAACGILSPKEAQAINDKHNQILMDIWKRVREEALPDPSTIYDHTFQGQKGKYWR